MTMEQRKGLTSSRRTVILLLYNKVQLFLLYIQLFLYSPVQSALKHDEAMSEVSGDQNESGSCPGKGRLRAADLPVVEKKIRLVHILWDLW
jgi:hypothetical protein